MCCWPGCGRAAAPEDALHPEHSLVRNAEAGAEHVVARRRNAVNPRHSSPACLQHSGDVKLSVEQEACQLVNFGPGTVQRSPQARRSACDVGMFVDMTAEHHVNLQDACIRDLLDTARMHHEELAEQLSNIQVHVIASFEASGAALCELRPMKLLQRLHVEARCISRLGQRHPSCTWQDSDVICCVVTVDVPASGAAVTLP
jgi:hypothetical protein